MSATGPTTDRCQEEFSFTGSIFLFYFVKTFALCCPANSLIRNTFSKESQPEMAISVKHISLNLDILNWERWFIEKASRESIHDST